MGTANVCTSCRSVERDCAGCGKRIRHTGRFCGSCRRRERVCDTEGCEVRFKGTQRFCRTCTLKERTCDTCGKQIRGTERRCWACRTPERQCETCGKQYKGTNTRLCSRCVTSDRTCDGCGCTFHGNGRYCPACYRAGRACETCGRAHNGGTRDCRSCKRKAADREELAANERRWSNARRARKLAAQVAGPVPKDAYAAIMASGPCVYCGAAATSVDHVRPLARGGAEHESNLVPACKRCNYRKNNRLLTEWRAPDRVAHGIEHSEKVAAEHARLLSLAAA